MGMHSRRAVSAKLTNMRARPNRVHWLLGSAFFIISLQFWMLVVMSQWVVDDSYAVKTFSATHPLLGFLVAVLWFIGDMGGAIILPLSLAALLCWLHFSQPGRDGTN